MYVNIETGFLICTDSLSLYIFNSLHDIPNNYTENEEEEEIYLPRTITIFNKKTQY